jgi:hypothetical protein
MPMTEDQYQNKRSWLIDTAETPQDKKNLKADLAKLDALYKTQKAAAKAAAKATPKPTVKPTSKATSKATTKAPAKGSVAKTFDVNKLLPKMTKEDAAMKKLLEKKYGKIYG